MWCIWICFDMQQHKHKHARVDLMKIIIIITLTFNVVWKWKSSSMLRQFYVDVCVGMCVSLIKFRQHMWKKKIVIKSKCVHDVVLEKQPIYVCML